MFKIGTLGMGCLIGMISIALEFKRRHENTSSFLEFPCFHKSQFSAKTNSRTRVCILKMRNFDGIDCLFFLQFYLASIKKKTLKFCARKFRQYFSYLKNAKNGTLMTKWWAANFALFIEPSIDRSFVMDVIKTAPVLYSVTFAMIVGTISRHMVF